MTMDLNLSTEEATELAQLVDSAVGDLSPEIAATDNPAYRAMLRGRRDHLRSVSLKLHDTGGT